MPVNRIESLLERIADKNKTIHVSMKKIPLEETSQWFYDEENGEIRNESRSFFQIKGLQITEDNKVISEQPVII